MCSEGVMEKPVIVIVGGAWHTAEYLIPLAKVFEEAGYPAVSLGLPSAGASPAAKDFSGDVAAIRNLVNSLIAEKRDIVAILHSFGGLVGTEALHGLGKQRGGVTGGVIALVYIASMVPKAGNSFDSHLEACGDTIWQRARKVLPKDNMIALPPDFAMNMFYNDLEESQAKHWTSLLKPQSEGVYDSPLTHETYKDIHSGYLLTTKDQAFPYNYQLKTVQMAGFAKELTKTMGTGHAPFLTKPEEVKNFVLQIAGGSGVMA